MPSKLLPSTSLYASKIFAIGTIAVCCGKISPMWCSDLFPNKADWTCQMRASCVGGSQKNSNPPLTHIYQAHCTSLNILIEVNTGNAHTYRHANTHRHTCTRALSHTQRLIHNKNPSLIYLIFSVWKQLFLGLPLVLVCMISTQHQLFMFFSTQTYRQLLIFFKSLLGFFPCVKLLFSLTPRPPLLALARWCH